jgi:hypothetical protein
MSHPTAATTLRDRRCRHPRHLLTSTSTLHPPTATASRNGCHHCCPCLLPCRRSMTTLHPTPATASRDCLCPCLPPCRRSTSRVNIAVASYHHHRHTRSSLLLSSPSLSLSLPPVNVAHQHRIFPPPPPCARGGGQLCMRAVEDGGGHRWGVERERSIDHPSIGILKGGEGIERSRGKHSPSPWHNARVMRMMIMLLPPRSGGHRDHRHGRRANNRVGGWKRTMGGGRWRAGGGGG